MTGNLEFDLIQKLNEKNSNENIVFSPIGLEIVLSLSSNGAEGETQKEILKVLNFRNIDKANETSKAIIKEFENNKEALIIANSILTKIRAKENFIKKGLEYEAKIEELKNYRQVNEWAKKKTKNNINKIIDKLDDNVYMILLNALYFESFWDKKFDPQMTQNMDFLNCNDEKQISKVKMMFKSGEKLGYYENNNLQAVKLNYEEKAKSINAIVILPNKEIHIDSLIKQFNNQIYEEIINGLEEKNVNLFIPQFEIEFTINMNEILEELGIKRAFTKDAEFKGICEKLPLFIGKVLQKNYINVNEEGTQASSITEVDYVYECSKSKDKASIDFIADRPFIFILRNSNLPKGHDILFFSKLYKIEDDEDYY